MVERRTVDWEGRPGREGGREARLVDEKTAHFLGPGTEIGDINCGILETHNQFHL